MTAMPAFRTGAEAADEASKSGFARTEFFSLDDGKTAILRFLTDAWVTVDQHNFIPTKPEPEDYKGSNWPAKMGAVCRYDKAFREAGTFSDCYICDHIVDGKKVKKPSPRQWALACLREEVVGDGSEELGGPENKGKVIGIRDLTREVTIPADKEKDRPEKKITEKAIVVVNMGYKNFFSVLKGFVGRYGTIMDRDLWIKRDGDDKDTTYQIVPLDPIETEHGRFGPDHPEFEKRYAHEIDLAQVIMDRASDDYYARFFDPRVTPSKEEGGKPEKTGVTATPPKGDNDVDPAHLEALASRVKGYSGSTPPTEDDKPKQAAAAGSGSGMKDFS